MRKGSPFLFFCVHSLSYLLGIILIFEKYGCGLSRKSREHPWLWVLRKGLQMSYNHCSVEELNSTLAHLNADWTRAFNAWNAGCRVQENAKIMEIIELKCLDIAFEFEERGYTDPIEDKEEALRDIRVDLLCEVYLEDC